MKNNWTPPASMSLTLASKGIKGKCFQLMKLFSGMENNSQPMYQWKCRFWSWYGIYIVKTNETQRGQAFCVPMDNQSCLIVFAFLAAAVALILRHIPFKSSGQAFIAWAYQMDKEYCLNNWTISYQRWHPYKDLPLTASAQTGEWIIPHAFVPEASASSSGSDHKIEKQIPYRKFWQFFWTKV